MADDVSRQGNTFESLPPNRNDKENARFGLDANDRIGVRVIGGTTAKDGSDLSEVLVQQVRDISTVLSDMQESLEIIANHMRVITSIEADKGEKF